MYKSMEARSPYGERCARAPTQRNAKKRATRNAHTRALRARLALYVYNAKLCN